MRKKGFTFVETLLSVIILGAIATVAAKVLVVGLDIYALVANRHDASQTARLAMERMVDETELIHWIDILGMENTRFRFIDADGHTTNFRQTTVSKNGRSVVCVYREDDFLAGDATYFDFDYLKADGSNTIWSWEVKRINIDLVITAPANAGSVHLRTEVFPRNLMYSNFQ
jgi:prepilin-type N-terminal cleavage/methylation domain-containing protein